MTLLAVLFLATGCVSSVPVTQETPTAWSQPPERKWVHPSKVKNTSTPQTPRPSTNAVSMVEYQFRAEARSWEGVPYKWGGTTRRGVDCSGFVQRMYLDTFRLQIPRTTADQVHAGVPVSRHALLAGDLVFFKTPRRHVGIYLCCGEFVHSSSSKGVTISRLDSPYWQRAYWTARRVMAATTASAPAPAPRAQTRRSTGSRTAW